MTEFTTSSWIFAFRLLRHNRPPRPNARSTRADDGEPKKKRDRERERKREKETVYASLCGFTYVYIRKGRVTKTEWERGILNDCKTLR